MYDLYKRKDAICQKCHELDVIDCTGCYCPAYHEDCGGNVKDCTWPHTRLKGFGDLVIGGHN